MRGSKFKGTKLKRHPLHNWHYMYKNLLFFLLVFVFPAAAQVKTYGPQLITVAQGWAKNSVNAVIFRRNSLITHQNFQYIAYYSEQGKVVLGKRKLNSSKWDFNVTQYSGNVKDAHNSISIMVDGDGYLHMAWDHHNHPLRYCKSKAPGSLEMTEKLSMTGKKENKVTYPEFYRLPDGNLMFLYRDGSSGNGNLMLNFYNTKKKEWTQLQDGWINGEGERNAYWQMNTDIRGTIHISWVWRETGDVATNHDMCYARSNDGGKTWEKSTGEKYTLPITAKTAEYALKIPQKSELINTTSMAADKNGRPYIISYWKDSSSDIPQYRLIYLDKEGWKVKQISDRKTPFTLAGAGTKNIPISRPQIMVSAKHGKLKIAVIYRDAERGAKVTAAVNADESLSTWKTLDLTSDLVDAWEPTYDTELWSRKEIINLFVQKVAQGDAETLTELQPTEIKILHWKPLWK